MRTLFKYFYIIGLILTIFSCTDFLSEDPRGLQLQETFYTTDSEALGGLMGLYAQVQSTNCLGQNFIVRNEAVSDIFTYKPAAASDGLCAQQMESGIFNY